MPVAMLKLNLVDPCQRTVPRFGIIIGPHGDVSRLVKHSGSGFESRLRSFFSLCLRTAFVSVMFIYVCSIQNCFWSERTAGHPRWCQVPQVCRDRATSSRRRRPALRLSPWSQRLQGRRSGKLPTFQGYRILEIDESLSFRGEINP